MARQLPQGVYWAQWRGIPYTSRSSTTCNNFSFIRDDAKMPCLKTSSQHVWLLLMLEGERLYLATAGAGRTDPNSSITQIKSLTRRPKSRRGKDHFSPEPITYVTGTSVQSICGSRTDIQAVKSNICSMCLHLMLLHFTSASWLGV